MIIKTKKYKLPESLYIKINLKNTLISKWWVFAIGAIMVSIALVFKIIWLSIVLSIAILLYIFFWYIQFYAVTKLDQNKIMFEKLSYEITSSQIMIKVNTKHAIPIPWSKVSKLKVSKEAITIIIDKAQLIHLPNKVFNNNSEIAFLKTIAKRKGL